jgi:phosphosulfolactate phosphohydrolase-like enzyme
MDSEITENSIIFINTCNGIKILKDLAQASDNLLRSYLNNFRD